MSGKLIEIYAPEFVDGQWRAAAQINLADGPIRFHATAPGALVARYLARLQSFVALRELRQLGAVAGDGAASAERALEGQDRAARIVAAAASGNPRAHQRILAIYSRAAEGDPAAQQAARWLSAAQSGEVGCGGVGCAHVGAAPMRDHDYALVERARALRHGLRRGVRLHRVQVAA